MILRQRTFRAGRAFTLIELMVSVGILALILTTFGMMLTQAQRAVTAATRNIHANQAANAIETVLRQDLRSVSPASGFLCITVHNGQPRLIMAYPGLALSPSGAARGTGACVSYGLVDNQGQRMAGQQRGDLALYRQNWVLNPFEARDTGVWQMDLGEVLVMDQTEVNGVVTDILNAAPSGASALHDPPRTMNHVESLWALLASGCSSMQIAWTAAEPGENITWQTANRVWTHHDPDAWPTAIRIRLELTDPLAWARGAPPAEERSTYEFILPVGAR